MINQTKIIKREDFLNYEDNSFFSFKVIIVLVVYDTKFNHINILYYLSICNLKQLDTWYNFSILNLPYYSIKKQIAE